MRQGVGPRISTTQRRFVLCQRRGLDLTCLRCCSRSGRIGHCTSDGLFSSSSVVVSAQALWACAGSRSSKSPTQNLWSPTLDMLAHFSTGRTLLQFLDDASGVEVALTCLFALDIFNNMNDDFSCEESRVCFPLHNGTFFPQCSHFSGHVRLPT